MKEYRQNADWCEDDHPRDSDGKFIDKQARSNKQQAEKEKVANKFRDTESISKPKRQQSKLSKQQYAIVCQARAEKVARQKRAGKIPKNDYIYTDRLFVAYKNLNAERFSVMQCVVIEGNEEYIDVIWRKLDGK